MSNLIDTMEMMSRRALQDQARHYNNDGLTLLARDYTEAIETVRAMQEALREIVRNDPYNKSSAGAIAREVLRRAEGNAG